MVEADRWSSGGPAEERQGIPLSFLDWRAGPIRHYIAVENSYGLRKHCRIWEGGIPCLFLRW
ncbi:MAG: hypothetical protein ABSG56_36895, partial [Bryobacteraceae bacterium]